MLSKCCFAGCQTEADWTAEIEKDQTVAGWLPFMGRFASERRFIAAWLCPSHAEQYGWINADLDKAIRGESPSDGAVLAKTIEALSREDPEIFDGQRMNCPGGIIGLMRARNWPIEPVCISVP